MCPPNPRFIFIALIVLGGWGQQTSTYAQEKVPPKAENAVAVASPKATVPPNDKIAQLQATATVDKIASWGHWGNRPSSYSAWTNHSNRLIPVYVFGDSFAPYMNEGSVYRDAAKLEALYRRMPTNTLRADAPYADQTDVYRLQLSATEERGKKYVFLVIRPRKLQPSTSPAKSDTPKAGAPVCYFKTTINAKPTLVMSLQHPMAMK
jgi:hypothetical protein